MRGIGILSHHSSSPCYNTTTVADIALSRLVDLLKNDRGRTIEEDLTGEGMRGDVLTLVRLGVISPLRVLYEVGGVAATNNPSALVVYLEKVSYSQPKCFHHTITNLLDIL